MSADERTVVVGAIKFFHRERYELRSFVVMDDHVHVIVRPLERWTLEQLVHSWKTFSARKINAMRSRAGSFWMSEYMDRIIRHDDEMKEKTAYVLGNPEKRWPGLSSYPWVEELRS